MRLTLCLRYTLPAIKELITERKRLIEERKAKYEQHRLLRDNEEELSES